MPLYPDSIEHAETLQTAFSFQGYIEKTEHRAITLKQLQRILHFATIHCSSWHDTSPPAYSKTAGQQLNINMLNLYHINAWLIMPSTKDKDCAFVEMLAGEKQIPKWFISHWWGERFAEFVECVAAHVQVRQLPEGVNVSSKDWPPRAPRTEAVNGSIVEDLLDENTAFWVCAYANRQHSLQNELVANPEETSFYKAMQLSVGILLILNDETEDTMAAIAFTRIWCAFEESTCLTQTGSSRMLLDIAAATKNRKGEQVAHILTDGIAAVDSAINFGGPKLAPELKRKRENKFPMQVIAQGLQAELEKAQASAEIDKTRILNCLAKRDLDLPPLAEHENYTNVNQMLRATFALAVWHQALLRSSSEKDWVMDLQLPEIVAADENRKSLHMDFTGFENYLGNEEVEALARAIPVGLLELTLSFQQCDGFRDRAVVGLAEKFPHTLKALTLSFLYCSVTDIGISAVASKLPASIRTLDLNFGCCSGITDSGVAALADKLPQDLHTLTLSFALCNVSDVGFSALANKLPSTLKCLMLAFTSCSQLTDVALETLAKRIPSGLDNFRASFRQCDKLSDASVATLALALPDALGALHVDFSLTQVAQPQEWRSLQTLRDDCPKAGNEHDSVELYEPVSIDTHQRSLRANGRCRKCTLM